MRPVSSSPQRFKFGVSDCRPIQLQLCPSSRYDFLGIEATVGQRGREEDDEEEFGKLVLIFGMPLGLIVCTVEDFLINEDGCRHTSEHGTLWRPSSSLAPTDFTQEASEIRARFARRPTGASGHRDNLLYYLVPRVSDPSLWSVRVKVRVSAHFHFTASHVLKPGYESEIVLQIAHRTILTRSKTQCGHHVGFCS
jgi:hypothetical protein